MNALSPNNPFIEAGKRALESYELATYDRALKSLGPSIIQAGWQAYFHSLMDGTAFNNKAVNKSVLGACKYPFEKAFTTLAKNPKATLGTAALSLAGLAHKKGLLFSYEKKKTKKPVLTYDRLVNKFAIGI